MSPSSRYGSASGVQSVTPVNRRKIQQNSSIKDNNLTPGSLVKLQQAYSLQNNGIYPLDVSSLGGSSGAFEPNGSHYHKFKRRSVGSEMYSP
jgi:hypothetical protein